MQPNLLAKRWRCFRCACRSGRFGVHAEVGVLWI